MESNITRPNLLHPGSMLSLMNTQPENWVPDMKSGIYFLSLYSESPVDIALRLSKVWKQARCLH